MNSNEFVYWLKGIVDSTDFMPTKKNLGFNSGCG